jgi:hypothetical protein
MGVACVPGVSEKSHMHVTVLCLKNSPHMTKPEQLARCVPCEFGNAQCSRSALLLRKRASQKSVCSRHFASSQRKVVVEWLTFFLRIRDVSVSNLGPKTCYSDWGFSRFSSVPPGWKSALKLGHNRFLPHPLQFIIYLLPLYSTLHSLSHWKSAVK